MIKYTIFEVIKLKPVIAIVKSSYILYHLCADFEYIRALKNCGAEVKFVKNTSEALKCDGILFTGGSDITPCFYGEEKDEKCGKTNLRRDTLEREIFNEFYKTGKPIFGICRGMQFINVCLKGSVYQDITDMQKEKHKDNKKLFNNYHKVKIKKDSFLSRFTDKKEITVNSTHHQAVKTLGENLKAAATSHDGFIESYESTTHPFCMGVQWHPEHIFRKDTLQRKVIEEFVNKCKK